jgi:hypothetical protein
MRVLTYWKTVSVDSFRDFRLIKKRRITDKQIPFATFDELFRQVQAHGCEYTIEVIHKSVIRSSVDDNTNEKIKFEIIASLKS